MATRMRYINEQCMVPGCMSSTIRTPNKRFVMVPKREDLRLKWNEACGREKRSAVTTRLYCCEDHFDVETDCYNVIQHNLTGCRLKLKDNVVPHKFDCQQLPRSPKIGPSFLVKKQGIVDDCSDTFVASTEGDPKMQHNTEFDEENKLTFRRFSKYFFLKESDILTTTMRVQCTLCTKMLTTCRGSSSNLLRHLRRSHPEVVPLLPPPWFWRKKSTNSFTTGQGECSIENEISMAVNSIRSGSDTIQPKKLRMNANTEDNFAPNVEENSAVNDEDSSASCRVEQLILNYVVNGLHPVHLVERSEFQNLVTGLRPGASIMDRMRLETIISENANNVKQQLRNILSDISHVCLTADGWRVFDRYYLGVSVHWIDPSTFERRSAILCCRRLCGPHSLPDIIMVLSELEREFPIKGKVTQVTIDNGFNFTKPCRIFLGDAKDEEMIEIPERDYEFVELYPVFNSGQHSSSLNVPPFDRCVAHTMDLLVNEDTQQAESESLYGNSMREALFRCQNLWRVQSASLQNAEFVKSKLGSLLEEPKENSWRSQYRALKHMRSLFDDKVVILEEICDTFDLPKFREVDKVFIDEYCKVMRPVSAAFDALLAKNNAFMGVLLPVIHALSRRLTTFRDQASNQDLLVICFPLLEAVLDGLSKRFDSHMLRKDLILASVLHPEFQFNWLKDVEKEAFATECLKEAVRESFDDGVPSDHSEDDDDELFDFIRPTAKSNKESKWQSEVEQYLSFSTGQMKSLNSYPHVKNLFLQHNTALPATAGTEKTFVTTGDIFALRGGSLNDSCFEDMVIIKMGIK